jgi:hypothetical protein
LDQFIEVHFDPIISGGEVAGPDRGPVVALVRAVYNATGQTLVDPGRDDPIEELGVNRVAGKFGYVLHTGQVWVELDIVFDHDSVRRVLVDSVSL